MCFGKCRLGVCDGRNHWVTNLDKPCTLEARALMRDAGRRGTRCDTSQEQTIVWLSKAKACCAVLAKVEFAEVDSLFKGLKVRVGRHVDSGHVPFTDEVFQHDVWGRRFSSFGTKNGASRNWQAWGIGVSNRMDHSSCGRKGTVRCCHFPQWERCHLTGVDTVHFVRTKSGEGSGGHGGVTSTLTVLVQLSTSSPRS